MGLTVKDLRKKLRGLPPDMPVYIADHDHSEYEWNCIAGQIDVVDQSQADEFEKEMLKNERYGYDWSVEGALLGDKTLNA